MAERKPKRPTSARKKPKRVAYKKIAVELAQRVKWALSFLKLPGDSGMVVLDVSKEPIKTIWWEDWFMDGLDMVGYRIDRKAYYERKNKKPRRRGANG